MLRYPLSICIFLLLAGCQPALPAATAAPTSAPPPTAAPAATLPPTATLTQTAAPTLPPTPTPSIAPALFPPMTREVAFAYHVPSAQLVAFGGINPNAGGDFKPYSETWVWQNQQWSKRDPAHSPPPRSGASLTYDAARGVVVLFGGSNGVLNLNDTWLWDGQDWTQAQTAPSAAPTPRLFAQTAYDQVHQQVVLWGGQSLDATLTDYNFLQDTWTWDGKLWTQHNVPGPENGAIPPASMAYDANLRQIVLWQYGAGLWIWDGSAWQKRPAPGPDPETEAQIGFDAARSQLVLRGSRIEDPHDSEKTWTFDGVSWTQVESRAGPGTAYYQDAQMAYNPSVQALFYITPAGGKSEPSRLEMLAWNGSAWIDAAVLAPSSP